MTAPINHADRDHAVWSASATAGNWACPGRLALTMNLPDSTSEAADWGTCAHQLSERCLRDGGDADRFIGTTEKGKVYSFEIDEEMAETAQTYVDYVRKVHGDGATLWIEQRFTMADVNPPFDAGGTGDAVIYLPKEKRLEVVDLKGGRGVVVEAAGNPQLRTYALGALLANRGLAVDCVTVTIVQPRAPHPSPPSPPSLAPSEPLAGSVAPSSNSGPSPPSPDLRSALARAFSSFLRFFSSSRWRFS